MSPFICAACAALMGVAVTIGIGSLDWLTIVTAWGITGFCLGIPLAIYFGPNHWISKQLQVFGWATIPISLLSYGIGLHLGIAGGILLIIYIAWRIGPGEPRARIEKTGVRLEPGGE